MSTRWALVVVAVLFAIWVVVLVRAWRETARSAVPEVVVLLLPPCPECGIPRARIDGSAEHIIAPHDVPAALGCSLLAREREETG